MAFKEHHTWGKISVRKGYYCFSVIKERYQNNKEATWCLRWSLPVLRCTLSVFTFALFLLSGEFITHSFIYSSIQSFAHSSMEQLSGTSHVLDTEDAKIHDIIPMFQRLDLARIGTDS